MEEQKHLDLSAPLWDIPTMPTVKKLDSKRRLVFPDLFEPGDVFIEESSIEGKVVFSLVLPDTIPTASTVMDGDLLVLDMPIQRDLIKKAIRKERDSK